MLNTILWVFVLATLAQGTLWLVSVDDCEPPLFFTVRGANDTEVASTTFDGLYLVDTQGIPLASCARVLAMCICSAIVWLACLGYGIEGGGKNEPTSTLPRLANQFYMWMLWVCLASATSAFSPNITMIHADGAPQLTYAWPSGVYRSVDGQSVFCGGRVLDQSLATVSGACGVYLFFKTFSSSRAWLRPGAGFAVFQEGPLDVCA
tara:strand:+ start:10837 stop:11454 length:618 start_codon:yes stop_codon:yes gene_type:complete